MPPRIPDHRYRDPLDRIWLTAAARIGYRITRTPGVYASTDGKGTIELGAPETLDPDDCLAQMILHELCHALVEAPAGLTRPDWGLDQTSDRDVGREHACLRLQAALLAPYGLRSVLAPTTDHRAFYDALPADPLAAGAAGDDEPVTAARMALVRARKSPWSPHLDAALAATAAIAQAAAPFGEGQNDDGLPSLWARVTPPVERHPTGLPLSAFAALAGAAGCGDCAWRYDTRGVSRCRQAADARVDTTWPACERWDAALDCQTCGACCRAAYDSVEISRREPVIKRHPEMVVVREKYLELRREGDRCAALHGGRALGERYECVIYDDRPRTCREFTLGSAHCLDARRRVGLSR